AVGGGRPAQGGAEGGGARVGFAPGRGVVQEGAGAARGAGDERRADRRVDQVISDVEQLLARGGVAEPPVEVGGDGSHWASFRRSLRMPAEAAWRAAVAFDPSAAPMSA